MGKWFNRAVGFTRAWGAGTTLLQFLKSQAAAVYLWGPALTAWGFIAGWREQIATPYLLAGCSVTFGAVVWCFAQANNVLDRFKTRYQKLKIAYDRNTPSCRADVTFGDGTHSICFRIRVENITTSKLHGCEGWLVSTDKFPNISAVKLFWAGSPGADLSVDLIKGVPRFLQVCRISDDNRIHMATEDEVWPIDHLNSFHPGNFYIFKIALKGDDNAETSFCSVQLNWTGNWNTSEISPVD